MPLYAPFGPHPTVRQNLGLDAHQNKGRLRAVVSCQSLVLALSKAFLKVLQIKLYFWEKLLYQLAPQSKGMYEYVHQY